MQVPVLIIMDANKQTMALIKIRSLWGQWKFWICTVASSGAWTLAMWGSRLGTSAGHCLVDTDTRGPARGAAQTRNHFTMISHQPVHQCCCWTLLRWSWVETYNNQCNCEEVVNEDQHWSRMVDVLTVYLEDWSVAVEQNLI